MLPCRAWFALAVGLALAPRPAAANGAFPGSQALLLPADRPLEIVLATNFGLLISEDGGTSWQWTCERPETSMGALYGVGAPPDDRLFSLSPDVGLAVSNDGSCSWRRSGGPLAALVASDYFPDPTDSSRVLAIAAAPGAAGVSAAPPALYASSDAGATFGPLPLYTAPDGASLTGVEVARSDPRIVTLATLLPGAHPALLRSADGGASFTAVDVEAALGPYPIRIVAVDPTDPNVIYLRVLAAGGDALAITRDGGASFQPPLTVSGGSLSAFVRLASGTLLAAGLVPSIADGGTTTSGVAWRSTDGGRSFQDWAVGGEPHLVALAERNGTLFLAGQNSADGWAVATSTDEGATIRPLARYDQVTAVKACAFAACQDACDSQAGVKVWSPAVCAAAPTDALPPTDAAVQSDPGPGGRPAGGCGCQAAPHADAVLPVALGAVFAMSLRRPRRRFARR